MCALILDTEQVYIHTYYIIYMFVFVFEEIDYWTYENLKSFCSVSWNCNNYYSKNYQYVIIPLIKFMVYHTKALET